MSLWTPAATSALISALIALTGLLSTAPASHARRRAGQAAPGGKTELNQLKNDMRGLAHPFMARYVCDLIRYPA